MRKFQTNKLHFILLRLTGFLSRAAEKQPLPVMAPIAALQALPQAPSGKRACEGVLNGTWFRAGRLIPSRGRDEDQAAAGRRIQQPERLAAQLSQPEYGEIGRASCRGRV